jgi:hypothetical protein
MSMIYQPHKAHDELAKHYLALLLDSLGEAKTGYELVQALQVDVMFLPTTTPSGPSPLGLLAPMCATTTLLEVFWNQPHRKEIRECLFKLLWVQKQFYKTARREKKRLAEEALPKLWILTTSASNALLTGFHAKAKPTPWGQGIYFFGDSLKTALVAINQLPVTPETLWLRLLGKGATREQALGELRALPTDHPLRYPVLELFADYFQQLQTKTSSTNEEQELIMELSPAYLQWREETLQQGRQQGRQEGRQEGRFEERRVFIQNLLTSRFGQVDETLSWVIDPLLNLSPEETIQLLLNLSRQELLAKFRH